MKKLNATLFVMLIGLSWTAGSAFAEDPAPQGAVDQTTATTDQAPTPPPVAEEAYNLENLEFSSGEIVSFEAASGMLNVKVYLDTDGNASEKTLSLKVTDKTELTDGENALQKDALTAGAEVDVEYDVKTNEVTYIFVY